MDIFVENYFFSFLSYKYDTDLGIIKKRFWNNRNLKTIGYLKNHLLSKYVYWITVDKNPIFQHETIKYNIYDNDISIQLKKNNRFMFEFSIFKNENKMLTIRYFKFFEHIDLDETDQIDFDFFYFIYSVWLNKPNNKN